MTTRTTDWRTSPAGRRISALLATGYTGAAKDIAARVHCHSVTCYDLLALMRADKAVHICDWRHGRGGWEAVYRGGKGRNKPRPAPLGRPGTDRRYIDRLAKRIGDVDDAAAVARRVRRAQQGTLPVDAIVVAGRTVWRRGEGVIETRGAA